MGVLGGFLGVWMWGWGLVDGRSSANLMIFVELADYVTLDCFLQALIEIRLREFYAQMQPTIIDTYKYICYNLT